MIIYGVSQFVVNWVLDWGLVQIFGALAGLMSLFILFGVPLWIFGKRFRAWIAKHPALFADRS